MCYDVSAPVLFKLFPVKSNIHFLVARSYFLYCCFIDNTFSEALAVAWASVFFFADSSTVCYLELVLPLFAVAETVVILGDCLFNVG